MPSRPPLLAITALILLFFGLFSHWLTYSPASTSASGLFAIGWFSGLHLLLGSLALIAHFFVGTGSVGEFVGRRSTQYGLNTVVYSLAFVTVVAMLNFLGARHHRRFDMSASGVNSLSEQSLSIIKEIDAPVRIDVFVEGGKEPVLNELLDAYQYANPNITFEFIDPQVRPELAQKAGVAQVPTLRVERGEQSTLVTKTDEEAVTNAIHRMTLDKRKTIYFIEGHGEPSIQDTKGRDSIGAFATALRNQNYVVDALPLVETGKIPDDADLLIAPSPDRNYLPQEIEQLDAFLASGRRLLMMLEPGSDPQLAKFAARWGIHVGNNVIVDQHTRPFEGISLGLDTMVASYGDHPSVAPMKERTVFPLARSVAPLDPQPENTFAVALAFSAPTSWAEYQVSRLFDDSEAAFDEGEDRKGPIPVATAASALKKDRRGDGSVPGESSLIVVGDSTFVTNRYWQQLFNDAFALSLVGWLAGEETLISIGPRAIRTSRLLLTASEAQTVFYLSVMIFPEIILAIGMLVWWRRAAV